VASWGSIGNRTAVNERKSVRVVIYGNGNFLILVLLPKHTQRSRAFLSHVHIPYGVEQEYMVLPTE